MPGNRVKYALFVFKKYPSSRQPRQHVIDISFTVLALKNGAKEANYALSVEIPHPSTIAVANEVKRCRANRLDAEIR